ncbi:HAMP domain-containing protein [Nocardioides coralli]|uniref:HAMP domain-containing protein n=1 Tax=Nocardioides coralli TaxID=2872154 RepID=UPI001CA39E33|nr:HAMP domain-containing protein [Nocardioides coralli]QZY28434.1 HAMP domain-containing protein [Nocardioides coralli]
MRERLAAAFVLLAVLVLVMAGAVRARAVGDLLRDQEAMQLRNDAALVADVIDDYLATGRDVDVVLLDGLVRADAQLEFVTASGESVVATGRQFVDEDLLVSVVEAGDGGALTVRSGSEQVTSLYARELSELFVLTALVALLAGLAGWFAARWLARPFRELADAAAALGRGRFDVRLPETRIPEAQAIGQALRVSAAQLEARISRERDFAEHASHQLRTPLTSLRLELEDLVTRDDVDRDVKDAAKRCLARVDAVSGAAGELVALTRQGALVEGGQMMLGELATQITQSWSDRLADAGRTVTARAEGEIDQLFTPGPVEQILEALLDEVARGEGPVQLYFEGGPGHVRVVVPAGVAGQTPARGLDAVKGLVEPQGGRTSGDLVGADLEIWMPRR